MIIYEGIGGLVLFLAMAVLAIYFYGRNQRDIGYEEGRADQYTALGELAEMAELADRHEHRATGRHAAGTMPRRELPPPLELDARPPWYREIPGPDRPQPPRDSGDGTVTFPRVQLPDATTGAIRAIGDAAVAAIEAAGTELRTELAL